MSVLFLMGAGASFGSGPCWPEPPPLGRDLFSKMEEWGGIARTVSPGLRKLFIGDFEKGMVAFAEQRNGDLNPFLRDMALYFVRFQLRPGNLYHELVAGIARSGRAVSVATTNYEMLIEQAIGAGPLALGNFGLPPEKGAVPVLKIHGSIHFLPQVLGTLRNVRFVNNTLGNVRAPVRAAQTDREIIDFFQAQDSLAPAIALYAPGKRVLNCPDHVNQIQQVFRTRVAEAELIFVVGLRVLKEDDHIWGTLATSPARIEYVGREPKEFQDWARDSGKDDVRVLSSTFGEGLKPMISLL